MSKELPTKLQKGDGHGLLDRWLNQRTRCKIRIVTESNDDDAKREHFFKLVGCQRALAKAKTMKQLFFEGLKPLKNG